ncbi:hypothetical protein Cpir12675_006492, partial [Ceratocystis pirilliformis]
MVLINAAAVHAGRPRHLEDLEMANPTTLVAYSDESKDREDNTGAGWVVTQNDKYLETGNVALGKWMEVADAEA